MSDQDGSELEQFAERISGKEAAHRDQRDAASESSARQTQANQLIYANASGEFNGMEDRARKTADVVNAKLSGDRYDVQRIAGGFAIIFGRESAGFSYSQLFGNAGPITLSVYLQRRQSNLAAFGIFPPEPTNEMRWSFEPLWDWNANAVRWRSDGRTLSSDDIIREAMSALMDRQS